MDIMQPAIYIVTNKMHGTLYTGVTSNLIKRTYEHKCNMLDGFTRRYNCSILVFYELYDSMQCAISREKQIKSGSRRQKLQLIEIANPQWKDLYEDIV
jgi:putative endonuclease